jgi:hypothetical protein
MATFTVWTKVYSSWLFTSASCWHTSAPTATARRMLSTRSLSFSSGLSPDRSPAQICRSWVAWSP